MYKDLCLCRTLNYRVIQLWHHTENETVGVKRADGGYFYAKWLGFISRDKAKLLRESGEVQPVKLHILCVEPLGCEVGRTK